MTFNEFKYLTSTCWDKKSQALTIDVTKDKYSGIYRLRLESLFAPHSFPFYISDMSIYRIVTEQDLINLSKLAEQQMNQRAIKYEKENLKQTQDLS